MDLCDYGCGQEAKFTFKNGKHCCSKNHGSCPNRKLSNIPKNSKRYKKINCKYCNKSISQISIKKHEDACTLNPINFKYCLNCNEIIASIEATKFCSSRCSALYSTPGRKHSVETKNKISESIKRVSPTHLTVSRWFEYECVVCKKKWKILQPDIYSKYIRQTCSKECYSKILSIKSIESGCGGYREKSTRAKSGHYKGIFCASSYELIFVAYHLDIGSNLKPCGIKIPYMYEGKSHNYHPDFFIDNKIYEMKGFYTEVVDIKTQAAINAGYEIDVLYLEKLQPMLEYLKEKYNFKNVLELYD
ncbi:MAG: hypothetical protein DRI84_02825 [Bacteroidetes bacterium]|nr:MAG: hypothetical protein DRI84_02825 [Bacteroidota bacterium]